MTQTADRQIRSYPYPEACRRRAEAELAQEEGVELGRLERGGYGLRTCVFPPAVRFTVRGCHPACRSCEMFCQTGRGACSGVQGHAGSPTPACWPDGGARYDDVPMEPTAELAAISDAVKAEIAAERHIGPCSA